MLYPLVFGMDHSNQFLRSGNQLYAIRLLHVPGTAVLAGDKEVFQRQNMIKEKGAAWLIKYQSSGTLKLCFSKRIRLHQVHRI